MDAAGQLARLCAGLREKAASKPDLDAEVRWSATEGVIDLGWARCELRADASELELEVGGKDADTLRELLTRHLEHALGDETIAWLEDGAPFVPDDERHGRDSMRAFHRRARHGH